MVIPMFKEFHIYLRLRHLTGWH